MQLCSRHTTGQCIVQKNACSGVACLVLHCQPVLRLCCFLWLQLLQLPDGSVQSQHAFLAEQLLGLIDSAGCINCLVWAKSDDFTVQVKQVRSLTYAFNAVTA